MSNSLPFPTFHSIIMDSTASMSDRIKAVEDLDRAMGLDPSAGTIGEADVEDYVSNVQDYAATELE